MDVVQGPILHIVYAGYGDALILEYLFENKRHIVVVDGGPKYQYPSGWSGRAPYDRYFISAVRDICARNLLAPHASQATDSCRLTAMICTHPHADHYEGLLSLLNYTMGNGGIGNGNERIMELDGPFIMPNIVPMPMKPKKKKGIKKKPGKKMQIEPDKNTPESHVKKAIDKITKATTDWGLKATSMDLVDLDVRLPGVHIAFPRKSDLSFFVRGSEFAPGFAPQQIGGDDPTSGGGEVFEEESPGGSDEIVEDPHTEAPSFAAQQIGDELKSGGGEGSDDMEEESPGGSDAIVEEPNTDTPALPQMPETIKRNARIDHSPENLNSILLTTRDVTGGTMLLTADNVGWRIATECFPLGAQPLPHYSVFKIQHHGSDANSQIGTGCTVTRDVAWELALGAIMELGYDGLGIREEDQDEAPPPEFIENNIYGLEMYKDPDPFVAWAAALLQGEPDMGGRRRRLRKPSKTYGTEVKEAMRVAARLLALLPLIHEAHNPKKFKLATYLATLRQRRTVFTRACVSSACMNLPEKRTEESKELEELKLYPLKKGFKPATLIKRMSSLLADLHPLKPRGPESQNSKDPIEDMVGKNMIIGKLPPEVVVKKLREVRNASLKYKLYSQPEVDTQRSTPDMWEYWCDPTQCEKWKKYYLEIMASRETSKFYSRFTADCYVVSANGMHGHPSPGMIVGLARALQIQRNVYAEDSAQRKRIKRLYVTNGACLNLRAIERLSRVFETSVESLIMSSPSGAAPNVPNHELPPLCINYLRTGTYMSLDGHVYEDDHADVAAANARQRDLQGCTVQLQLDLSGDYKDPKESETQQKLLASLRENLETWKTVLSNYSLTTRGGGRYWIEAAGRELKPDGEYDSFTLYLTNDPMAEVKHGQSTDPPNDQIDTSLRPRLRVIGPGSAAIPSAGIQDQRLMQVLDGWEFTDHEKQVLNLQHLDTDAQSMVVIYASNPERAESYIPYKVLCSQLKESESPTGKGRKFHLEVQYERKSYRFYYTNTDLTGTPEMREYDPEEIDSNMNLLQVAFEFSKYEEPKKIEGKPTQVDAGLDEEVIQLLDGLDLKQEKTVGVGLELEATFKDTINALEIEDQTHLSAVVSSRGIRSMSQGRGVEPFSLPLTLKFSGTSHPAEHVDIPDLKRGSDQFGLGSQESHMSGGVTSSNLLEYYEALGVFPQSTLSGKDALRLIMGAKNLSQMGMILVAERDIMAMQLYLNTSRITYYRRGASLVITDATLKFDAEVKKTSLNIAGQFLPVMKAELVLAWAESGDISSSLEVQVGDAMTITTKRSAASGSIVRVDTIQQIFTYACLQAGLSPPYAEMSLPALLAWLMDAPPEKVTTMLSLRLPVALVKAGFLYLKPDLLRSTAVPFQTPLGSVAVKHAEIVCSYPESPYAWKGTIDIAGFQLTLGEPDITVTVHNPRGEEDSTLEITSAAVITLSDSGSYRLALSVLVDLSPEAMAPTPSIQWTCTVTNDTRLTNLLSSLKVPDCGANSQLMDTSPPFSKSTLEKLNHSGIGFVLTQPVVGASDSFLSSIFFATTFKEWKNVFPAGVAIMTDDQSDATIRMEIRNPLESFLRRIAVVVEFSCTIPVNHLSNTDPAPPATKRPPFAKLSGVLSAEPLVDPKDYDYRLCLSASGAGVSLLDVLSAVGMNEAVKMLHVAVPLIGEVLDALRLRKMFLELRCEKVLGWSFGSYEFDVLVTKLDLIPGFLSLANVKLHVVSYQEGFQCDCNGTVKIMGQELNVGVRVPQTNMPGYLTIDIPAGLSVDDCVDYAGFQQLHKVPLLGKFLSTRLESVQFELACAPTRLDNTGPATTQLTGASFQFHLDDLPIGKLMTLESITAKIHYESTTGPNGMDAESRILFHITAATSSGAFAVTVHYDTKGNLLRAWFHPNEVVSIAETVGLLLGQKAETALTGIIGDMGIASAYAELDFSKDSDVTVKEFKILLTETETVACNNAKLSSLELAYRAAYSSDKETIPASFWLVGHTSGTNCEAKISLRCSWGSQSDETKITTSLKPRPDGKVTAIGLLRLFSLNEPDNVPSPDLVSQEEYFDLAIKRCSGEAAVSKGTGLTLNSLEIFVESQKSLILLNSPLVELKHISLWVHYDKQHGTRAQFGGHVSLAEAVRIEVQLSLRNQSVAWYRGEVSVERSKERPGFGSLASYLLGSDTAWELPEEAAAPNDLSLASVSIAVVPKKSVAICASLLRNWKVAVAGLDLNVTQLNGYVLVNKISPTDTTYRATLFGSLEMPGFTSSYACLELVKGRDPIFFATLTKQDNQVGGDIGQLAAGVSKDPTSWSQLLPSGTAPLDFQTKANLYLNFHTGTFVVAGSMKGFGGGIMLAKRTSAAAGTTGTHAYKYLVLVVITDLAALWKALKIPVGDVFNFTSIYAHFVWGEWSEQDTMKHLIDDIKTTCEVQIPSAVKKEDLVYSMESDDARSTTAQELRKTLAHFPEETKILRGATFYANLSLEGSNLMTQALRRCKQPDAPPPRIMLWATLPREQPEAARFSIAITDFVLFGGALTIRDGEGTYSYSKEEPKKELRVNAKIDLLLAATKYKFDIKLVVKSLVTKFQLSNSSEDDTTRTVIKSPFGGMFELSLDVLSFTGRIELGENEGASGHGQSHVNLTYRLSGALQLGNMKLNAEIIFLSGVPNIVEANFDGKLSVKTVFNDVIQAGEQGKSAEGWPEESFDSPVIFEGGRVYYYHHNHNTPKSGTEQDSQRKIAQYRPGFNIETQLRLFQHPFEVTAHVYQDRCGLEIAGTYVGEIDLGFAQLTGCHQRDDPNGPLYLTKGPTVKIIVNNSKDEKQEKLRGKTRFEVNTGVRLFGQEGLKLSLSYAPASGGTFTGTAEFDKPTTILGNPDPKIAFLYKEGKFSISGWMIPQDWASDIVNIAEALKQGSNEIGTDCCEAITKLVFDKPLITRFTFSLSFTAGENGGPPTAKIDGEFKVFLAIGNLFTKNITTLKLPELVHLPLKSDPETFTMKGIKDYLCNTIKANLKRIGKRLLENPALVAEIIGWMAVKDWGPKLLTTLLCRKITPDNVIEEGASGESYGINSSLGASMYLLAPSSFGTEFAEVLAAYLILRALLAKLVEYLEEEHTAGRRGKEDLEKVKDQLEKLERMYAKHETERKELEKRAKKALELSGDPKAESTDSGKSITVTWNHVLPQGQNALGDTLDYANYKDFIWEVYASRKDENPSNKTLPTTMAKGSNYTVKLKDTALESAKFVYVWVRVKTKQEKHEAVSRWFAAQRVTQVQPLPSPKRVDLSFSPSLGKLLVTIRNAPDGRYWFRLHETVIGPDSEDDGNDVPVTKGWHYDHKGASNENGASTLSFPISIWDIDTTKIEDTPGQALLVATRMLSTDHAIVGDSETVYSDAVPVAFGAMKSKVKLAIEGANLVLSWIPSAGCEKISQLMSTDFSILLHEKDADSEYTMKALESSTINFTSMDTSSGLHKVSLPIPAARSETSTSPEIKFSILPFPRDLGSNNNIIPLYSTSGSIVLLPVPVLSTDFSSCYFDLPTHSLHLSMTFPFPVSDLKDALVSSAPLDKPAMPFKSMHKMHVARSSFLRNGAVLTVDIPMDAQSYPGFIRVVLVNTKDNRSTPSTPWTFPRPTVADPPLPEVSAVYNKEKNAIDVTWKAMSSPGVEEALVSLALDEDDTLSVEDRGSGQRQVTSFELHSSLQESLSRSLSFPQSQQSLSRSFPFSSPQANDALPDLWPDMRVENVENGGQVRFRTKDLPEALAIVPGAKFVVTCMWWMKQGQIRVEETKEFVTVPKEED